MNYYNVAVQAPLMKPLVYQSEQDIPIGAFVIVFLGSRKVKGLILSKASKPEFEAKNIETIDNKALIIDSKRLQWIEWLASYYFYSIGLTAFFCYPPSPPKKIKKNSSLKWNIPSQISSSPLNADQQKCVQNIQKMDSFKVHLLFGVTGSGKTQVYLQLIEDKIKQERSALVLVPEISLTPQLFSRFEARFPGQVALLHSGISSNKKYEEWSDLSKGKKKILLGARSAVFCSLPNLALIIVDEEHETHFKQNEKLKYHGRDAAIMLAKIYNIPIVLGSATPSLETWSKATSGKYEIHTLPIRFKNHPLPNITVVDLKKEKKKDFLPFWLSSSLFESIKNSLKKKEQTALFINRRGQASISLCAGCGKNQKCSNCDISLILHFDKYLVCHYCNYSIEMAGAYCSSCQKKDFVHLGIGSQSVYSQVKKLFPEAKVQLADSDHVYTAGQFKTLVEDMLEKKIDILIGTQMIAKGLDFPGLNLVGFILADLAFYTHDFRSIERCFQLLTQMAGRSGRHSSKPGSVIVQTYNPDHFAIQTAARMEFEKMAVRELEYRKKLSYPPYSYLTLVRISSIDKGKSKEFAQKLILLLEKISQNWGDSKLKYLGPAPAPIFKLRSRYRYHILIKSPVVHIMQSVCSRVMSMKPTSGVQIQLNRDPVIF